MHTTEQLRAHLNTIAPGFFVHTILERDQYSAVVFIPGAMSVYHGWDDEDPKEAEREALLEAVGHLDSEFLLRRPQSDSESVSDSVSLSAALPNASSFSL